jgi:hypothetical protein
MKQKRYHLVLLCRAYPDTAAFTKIATYLREIDPAIRTFVIHRRRDWAWLPYIMLRPTLVFSPGLLERFRFWRGRIFCGRGFAKSEEYAVLEKAGIPVPRWERPEPGVKPDLAAYGPYVVTKPDHGNRGAMVRIRRAGRVTGETITLDRHSKPTEVLVQEFIHTGAWPVSYRVTILFGNTLFSLKFEGSHERAAVNSADDFGRNSNDQRGVNIAASGRGCTISLNYDEEIIRFGEAVHAAFPDIPLLGVDVLREAATGKLYVCEANPGGMVWHFSTGMGRRMQREFDFNFEEQFDGLRLAARILAQKTREFAC